MFGRKAVFHQPTSVSVICELRSSFALRLSASLIAFSFRIHSRIQRLRIRRPRLFVLLLSSPESLVVYPTLSLKNRHTYPLSTSLLSNSYHILTNAPSYLPLGILTNPSELVDSLTLQLRFLIALQQARVFVLFLCCALHCVAFSEHITVNSHRLIHCLRSVNRTIWYSVVSLCGAE